MCACVYTLPVNQNSHSLSLFFNHLGSRTVTMASRVSWAWYPNVILTPFINCVALGKLFNFSKLLSLRLYSRESSAFFRGILWRAERMSPKPPAPARGSPPPPSSDTAIVNPRIRRHCSLRELRLSGAQKKNHPGDAVNISRACLHRLSSRTLHI